MKYGQKSDSAADGVSARAAAGPTSFPVTNQQLLWQFMGLTHSSQFRNSIATTSVFEWGSRCVNPVCKPITSPRSP
jgi:hypothetical protein